MNTAVTACTGLKTGGVLTLSCSSECLLMASFALAGAHIIHLGSYVDFREGSEQYGWLQKDLERFSRAETPWLIVNFHAPWYHTYIAVSFSLLLITTD